ncbi:hypothetical protein KQI79_14860 [Paenibacillus sp. MSJ-34]|nr:hypothetical protein [Paenibacillus sp. MSJ-34]
MAGLFPDKGIGAHAEGNATGASGDFAHAEGSGSSAGGDFAHAEGQLSSADGTGSHAEGYSTLARGEFSHAEGDSAEAVGIGSHAEGSGSVAGGAYSHAEGVGTETTGEASHAEGERSAAGGRGSHAEGYRTIASGRYSHAEGFFTLASGDYSHVEGWGNEFLDVRNTASGAAAHAEGGGFHQAYGYGPTLAAGDVSHAEGYRTVAGGFASHAEGDRSVAGEYASHAEGRATQAYGIASHAEGDQSTASGDASHAEGSATIASGNSSHAEGISTDTNLYTGAHIMGRYGQANEEYSWHLAYGTGTTPHLAAKISGPQGQGIAENGWVTGAADYAEMFETCDGRPIDVGYFVTLEGSKIRKATASDIYILGITSATPGVVGDAAELSWKHKFMRDEWGRTIMREVIYPAEQDEYGVVIKPERKVREAVVNPAFDPSREYIPRSQRPEWVAVGLLGKLLVRDDGTCPVNGYCRPNDQGIATNAVTGYRVLERTGPNQILVLYAFMI